MSKVFKMGVIGLGQRGAQLVKYVLRKMDCVKVVALCDLHEDRVEDALKNLQEVGKGEGVFCTKNYKELLSASDVDCVLISCDWEKHAELACEAMESKKAVACEVGGAYTIEECFRLVDTYEKTKTPIMFMENCCFDKTEMTVANMAKDGVFGELVFLSGAYGHDLRSEVCCGIKNRHYRERNYLTRNCENYPTHELGPLAKLAKINRGNRMVRLTSVASKAAGMEAYIKSGGAHDKELEGKKFAQGDIVVTLITCEDGSVIQLKLDTCLPRSYHREYAVAGTKGRYTALYDEVFFDGDNEDVKGKPLAEFPQYLPEEWSEANEAKIKEAGHGGMDWLEFEAFFDCLEKGKEMPVDIYDMASWMAITPLSEASIKMQKSVEVPDFTRGKYKER